MKKGDAGSGPGVAGRHKVIQVSLQQDVKLHTAENAWKPVLVKKELTQDDDDASTQVPMSVCLSVCLSVCVSVCLSWCENSHSHSS